MSENLKRWHLLDAACLFLVGHRPLAFVVGQGLHLLAPAAAIVGVTQVAEWAEMLSQQTGLDQLEQQLRRG